MRADRLRNTSVEFQDVEFFSEDPRTSSIAVNESSELFNKLIEVYKESISDVPVLKKCFGACQMPSSWDDWKTLPITGPHTYKQIGDVREAIRDIHRLYSPVAPLDLSDPEFPITVPQSYDDKVVLSERVRHVLSLSQCEDVSTVTIVVDKRQIYAASDLMELLIHIGKQCSIVLTDASRWKDVQAQMQLMESELIFWLCSEFPKDEALPSSVGAVVTFNAGSSACRSIRHVNVLHSEVVPFFAVGIGDGFYSLTPDHFFLEATGTGGVILTTFKQDLFPLVRYLVGWSGEIRGDLLYLPHDC